MKANTFVPFWNVELNDGFWKNRYDLNKNVSIDAVRARFEESGRMDALRFNYLKSGKVPHIFYDSDVAKWIEGVAYLMEKDRASMAEHETLIDELVAYMEAAQRDDGYLNSYHQQIAPTDIFRIRDNHELYCMGHLTEAAVAYYHATGKDRFLRIMERAADCIWNAFFEQKTAAFSTPGHEEIELALFRLYECTGNERYRTMAKGFLTRRGHDGVVDTKDRPAVYAQDNVDIYSATDIKGHSVRALYLYCGAADMARIDQDEPLKESMKRVWRDLVDHKLYITGGFGSSYLNEGFTYAYDLPNAEAYSESCAAIAMALFAMRMRRMERNAEYGDVIERVLYNNGLSSTSLSGKAFFYENPLEIKTEDAANADTYHRTHKPHIAIRERVEVFSCSCCPPNINRFFAFLPELIFVNEEHQVCIEQYIGATATSEHGTIELKGDYALDGKMTVSSRDYRAKEIALRVPAWCKELTVLKNGKPFAAEIEHGYITVPVGTEFEISLDFHIAPRFAVSHTHVAADAGRVALCYGPVVYCLEGVDNGKNLNSISVDANALRAAVIGEPFGELCTIETNGWRDMQEDCLYADLSQLQTIPVKLKWIPYYTFANRGESDMLVWVRLRH